ncbi:hypothetical protein Q4I28_008402 [Leishmania naiffi]|uniref:HMG box domain-containing protein n=1 Tax=Leishmania naiffi TaxID=5678 RepID=A0AAW3B5E5_9TRYP
MLRITRVRRSPGRGKVFEIFCREQLLTNLSLRELTLTERRKAMSRLFKELPDEDMLALKQRASIEQLHQEALERAAAYFKPLTTYEFFTREQQDNPAVAGASPREKEMKLLQIYESLPENARMAIEIRAEQYNVAHSKKPTTPALPVIPVRKKPASPASAPSSAKETKKARRKAQKKLSKGTAVKAGAETSTDVAVPAKRAVKRSAGSPYSVFVREHMASLHHLAPKERMRVIGERWRSLTKEERQHRLEVGKAKLAEERAMKAEAAEKTNSSSPQVLNEKAAVASFSSDAPSTNATDGTNTPVAFTSTSSPSQEPLTPTAGGNSPATVITSLSVPPSTPQSITF